MALEALCARVCAHVCTHEGAHIPSGKGLFILSGMSRPWHLKEFVGSSRAREDYFGVKKKDGIHAQERPWKIQVRCTFYGFLKLDTKRNSCLCCIIFPSCWKSAPMRLCVFGSPSLPSVASPGLLLVSQVDGKA